MSDYFDLIRRRESCRNFDPNRPVEKEKLQRCAEAAWLAPSACNGQPWRYLVVTNPELVEKLRPLMMELNMNKFVKNCPADYILIQGAVLITTRCECFHKNAQTEWRKKNGQRCSVC